MNGSLPNTPSAGVEHSLVGSVLAGRYRIEKLLGSGGMGSVYRAEHVHMRKAVAIKVLHREMTYLTEVVARFEREAVAAARIEHPNVAAATDFGRLEDGSFYLVLEYVEGQSLRGLLKREKRLPSLRALHIARQIADALGAAHAAGVIHRDLKPDNVMLIERDGDPDFVKVLDFGIAKVHVEDQTSQQPLTQLGSIFGTPEYMAPEQAQGLPVDLRADLYTVGILLYEMLAGTTPFSDEDMVVVLTRQLTVDPPPLSNVEPALDALVRSLLAKAPQYRPASAGELVARIDQLLDGALSLSRSQLGPAGIHAPPDPTSRDHVQFSDTVLNVAQSAAGSASSTGSARAGALGGLASMLGRVRSLLAQPLRIGGQPVPVWALVTAGTLFVTGGILAAVLLFGRNGAASANGQPGDSVIARFTSNDADRELAAWIRKAEAGDPTAIAELTGREESRRSAAEWHALGAGHARLRQYAASVRAYRRALALDAAVANDPNLLPDLARALDDPAADSAALALAAKLGTRGADLVYDAWESSRKAKGRAELAKSARAELDDPALRAAASPALSIALELTKALPCPHYKKLLPRAIEVADARSLAPLKALTSTRGCGFLGLRDCYACLRGNKDLAAALKAAEERPAPRLLEQP